MFRASTIIREPALNLAKVIFMLKHSVNYEAYSESKGRLVSKKNIFVRHIFY